MWAQIAAEMSKLQEDPTQQAEPVNEAAHLQAQDQDIAEIMEEEMTHHEEVSVLSCMHLQQAEEVNPQSQEICHFLALVEQLQEAIKIIKSS